MSRNLHFCFNKMKSPPSTDHNLPTHDHSRPFSQSSSSLIRNFNSLYENFSAPAADHCASSSDSDAEYGASAPDIAAAAASRRFFFSSPGRSNSIVDSSGGSPAPSSPEVDAGGSSGGGIAVPTYSPDPFADFRRSMQEMVEAREVRGVREDWGYLHELLTCYLSLNPKSTHKFIVEAFADLLVSLVTEDARLKKSFSAAGKYGIARRRV
ncbi:Transcription repressor OFP12 [Striga hermonthica]|uniref:Transcription repressor n=1 Tax=Striga hermonthica TaxID=68872 RepID=A0A9N7NCV3_STRHE|nr:Transcription repressor OFP12 [Striga hermonthica]